MTKVCLVLCSFCMSFAVSALQAYAEDMDSVALVRKLAAQAARLNEVQHKMGEPGFADDTAEYLRNREEKSIDEGGVRGRNRRDIMYLVIRNPYRFPTYYYNQGKIRSSITDGQIALEEKRGSERLLSTSSFEESFSEPGASVDMAPISSPLTPSKDVE